MTLHNMPVFKYKPPVCPHLAVTIFANTPTFIVMVVHSGINMLLNAIRASNKLLHANRLSHSFMVSNP